LPVEKKRAEHHACPSSLPQARISPIISLNTPNCSEGS
jgi:hypothetical protein